MTTYTPKEFAAHLADAGRRMSPEVSRSMNRAAMSIRDDWFKRAREKNPTGGASASYPYSIRARYAKVTNGVITVSVEPVGTKSSQNRLGAILEYGGANNAPQLSNVAALNAEAPKLAKWLAKFARDAV